MARSSTVLARPLRQCVVLLVLPVALLSTRASAQLAMPAQQAVRLSAKDSVPVPSEVRRPDAPPVYPVLRVAKPPKIDGKLDDEAWEAAPPMGRFYLDNGDGPMRYETIVRMVCDDTYLYLAVDCRHPKIADVPVPKGVRKQVSWLGETVELFLHTDRAAADYVQVIFDMSGAFTETVGGVPTSNGDIIAATDIGGTGWRLEARLKITDLGRGGKINPYVWGANVARNSGDDSGSWARLLGSYQQPEHFGLLTFCDDNMAVENVGLGLFAPPAVGSPAVPVHITLSATSSKPEGCSVICTPVLADGHIDESRTTRMNTLVPGTAVTAIAPGDTDAVALTVLSRQKEERTLFKAVLPLRLDRNASDCLTEGGLTCAIRPACPVVVDKDQAAVYLMVRCMQEGPIHRSGLLSLVSLEDSKVLWQAPVEIVLEGNDAAAQRVALPVERMKDGQYRVDWRLDGQTAPALLQTELTYTSLGMVGIRHIFSTGRIEDVLAQLKCPLPKDTADKAIVQVWIDRLTESVQRQAEDKDLDLSARILRSYRQLMHIVSVLRTGQPYTASRRGWFETAFFSPVDGSAQPFSLFVPYDYDKHPDRKYPLEVWLHGHGGTHDGEAGFAPGKDRDITDRMMLNVLARGRAAGYRPITADEVIREIADTQSRYRVDADAVHLYGASMGGFGAFVVAATYPDVFATASPYCGGGEGEPLEQMCNLPTFIHHGLDDDIVPVFCSIVSALRMQELRCPVQFFTYPGVGHNVVPAGRKVGTWETLKDIRRDLQPQTVVLTGDLPPLKKAYWLSIPRYADVHKDAYARATFVSRNLLSLDVDNVAWLKIALPCKWIDATRPLRIVDNVGLQWTQIVPGDAGAIYIDLTGKALRATAQPPVDLDDSTVYTGGGPRWMFSSGRAIRIVYGTAGSAEQTETQAKVAAELRRQTPFVSLETGGLPVLKDTEVDDVTLKTCDLLLLGTPKDNAVLGRMAGQLPVKYVDGQIRVEANTAMSWPEGEVAFSLYYCNPLAPDRRIWWFAGQQDSKAMRGCCDIARTSPFGLLGPELIVQAKDSMQVVATADVTPQWKLVRPGPLQPAQAIWPSCADLDRQLNEALSRALPVDVSVVFPLFRANPFAWERLTVGEAMRTLAFGDLVVVPVVGKDLLRWRGMFPEMVKPVAASTDLPWAGVDPKAIEPDRVYDVLMLADSAVPYTLKKADVPLLQARPGPVSQYKATLTHFLRDKELIQPGKASTTLPAQIKAAVDE